MSWGQPHSPTTGDMERIDQALTAHGVSARDENGCAYSLAERVTMALREVQPARDAYQKGVDFGLRCAEHGRQLAGTFVLDLTGNPHPKMLMSALMYRRIARGATGDVAELLWRGYLAAMCDATGETAEAIESWLDRHEETPCST